MKPPVDAPASRHRRPATHSPCGSNAASAPASLWPPRETYSSPPGIAGSAATTRATSVLTAVAALVARRARHASPARRRSAPRRGRATAPGLGGPARRRAADVAAPPIRPGRPAVGRPGRRAPTAATRAPARRPEVLLQRQRRRARRASPSTRSTAGTPGRHRADRLDGSSVVRGPGRTRSAAPARSWPAGYPDGARSPGGDRPSPRRPRVPSRSRWPQAAAATAVHQASAPARARRRPARAVDVASPTTVGRPARRLPPRPRTGAGPAR